MTLQEVRQMDTMAVALPRRILVAIDESSAAREACRLAMLLARIAEAELLILHIATPATPRNPMGRAEALRVSATAEADGRRLLARAGLVAADQVPYRVELAAGNPIEVICRRARELDAELIVTGARGLGLFDRLLLGSVSAGVAQRAHCPVMVVHQPTARG